ncbi:hypothetical protein NC651_016669 [Populus alba x Populus x berolinensis]|nr:hypothetical protein NC651_016669 [Populus alba x Populus x berolinensis]
MSVTLYGFSFQRFLQERKLKKASRESETAIMGPFKTREPSCLVAYVSMHRSVVSPQEVFHNLAVNTLQINN